MTDLEKLIERAKAKYDAMTPQERSALHRAQRDSYARAEVAFGSDEDEAEYNAAILSGDADRIANCRCKEAARLAAYDKRGAEHDD